MLAATLAITLAACQTPDNASPASTTPAHTPADYPIIWIPTPHLDLNSPDGTFVRAFGESIYRSLWLSWAGVAPGFREAFDPMMRLTEIDGRPLFYRRDKQSRLPPHVSYIWAAPFIEPTPHDTDKWTPPGPHVGGVALCVRSTLPLRGGGPGLQFFTYRRAGQTPPADQRGSYPAPSNNVFGGWHALDWIDPTVQRTERCEHLPPGAPDISTKMRPSSPGWPAASQ